MLHMHFQYAKAYARGHSEQRERRADDEFHVLVEWEKQGYSLVREGYAVIYMLRMHFQDAKGICSGT